MRRAKGMALLIVMLLIALMATLAVSMNEFWQYAFTGTLAHQDRIQAKWHLLGGESFALQQLEENLANKKSVNLEQWWAKPDLVMNTEDANVEFTFKDRQACFNINSLNYLFPKPPEEAQAQQNKSDDNGENKDGNKSENKAGIKEPEVPKREITRLIFDNLLLNIGLTQAEAELVAKQIEDRLQAGGAQSGVLFGDISELRELKGLSREQYLRLRPLVCVLPDRKPAININTLTAEQMPLLRAIFINKLSQENINTLLSARPAKGWDSINDPELKFALTNFNKDSLDSLRVLTTDSNYFLFEASMKNERTGYYMKSLLHYQQQKIRIIRRQMGQGGTQ